MADIWKGQDLVKQKIIREQDANGEWIERHTYIGKQSALEQQLAQVPEAYGVKYAGTHPEKLTFQVGGLTSGGSSTNSVEYTTYDLSSTVIEKSLKSAPYYQDGMTDALKYVIEQIDNDLDDPSINMALMDYSEIGVVTNGETTTYTAGEKANHYKDHRLAGVESYEVFSYIYTVTDVKVFGDTITESMGDLGQVDSPPTNAWFPLPEGGEWRQIEHTTSKTAQGRPSLVRSWQWAESWSEIYGGSGLG